MGKITFSSDNGGFSLDDVRGTSREVDKEFGREKPEEEAMPTEGLIEWIYENCQNCLNVIKDGKKIIGHTFILPTSKSLMNKFLKKKINEKELFDLVMEEEVMENPQALYLCDAVVEEKYRRKGLAKKAYLKLLEQFNENMPVLYGWVYSKEGKFLNDSISKSLGVDILTIKD